MKQTNSNIGKFDKLKILIVISLRSIEDKFFFLIKTKYHVKILEHTSLLEFSLLGFSG